jgi:hypothetical protein
MAMNRRTGIVTLVLLVLLVVLTPTPTPPAHAQTNCADVTEIPQSECEALVALYTSTNGTEWTNNTGWNTTSTPVAGTAWSAAADT